MLSYTGGSAQPNIMFHTSETITHKGFNAHTAPVWVYSFTNRDVGEMTSSFLSSPLDVAKGVPVS
ncbi:MAG: hypothetical protein ABIU05_21590 [Nitrospirales bacterium]